MEAVVGLIMIGVVLLMLAGFMLFYITLFGFFILILVFWIVMVVDVVQRKFSNEPDRLIWVLVVILTGWVGALIYYFVIKRPEDLKLKTERLQD